MPDEKGENSCVFTRFWKIYDNKINILSAFGLLVFQFLCNVQIFFIVDKFSPSHFAMASIIGTFGSLLNSLIFFRTIDISEFFIRFFIYFILIIASSIHNEFIVINCFGLQSHTQLFLEKAAEKDIKSTNYKDLNFINNNQNEEENHINPASDESEYYL